MLPPDSHADSRLAPDQGETVVALDPSRDARMICFTGSPRLVAFQDA